MAETTNTTEHEESTLGRNAPKLQVDVSNFHERHTSVTKRALLYGFLDLLDEDPKTYSEQTKSVRFLVLSHENISPRRHQHCSPQSLRKTGRNLKKMEPVNIEAETDLLLKAFSTKLKETDIVTFSKTHTSVQAKLHRLNPDAQSATNR